MPTIFISYSRKDAAEVGKLVEALGSHQVKVWLDSEQIRIGENWLTKIDRAIEDASAVIVALSPNTKTSEWIDMEVGRAIQYDKRIIPVILAGDTAQVIPDVLRKLHYVDLRSNSSSIDELISVLTGDLITS